jgi:hypothetical protein
MSSNNLYLAAILVIAIVLIAFFACRRWRARRARREGYSYATPATPRVREAVGALFGDLRQMVALGRRFEAEASRLDDATAVAGTRMGAALMVKTLNRVEAELSGAPPTYANYLAVYRGMTSTDAAILAAADSYVSTGYEVQQGVARGSCAAPAGSVAEMGNTLVAMGRQLRVVVAAVHRLGVALDVE